MKRAPTLPHAIASEARLAICDIHGLTSNSERAACGREPTLHSVEKVPYVDQRIDVLIRVGLVEREHELGGIDHHVIDPLRAGRRLLRGGRCGLRVVPLGNGWKTVDVKPGDATLIIEDDEQRAVTEVSIEVVDALAREGGLDRARWDRKEVLVLEAAGR